MRLYRLWHDEYADDEYAGFVVSAGDVDDAFRVCVRYIEGDESKVGGEEGKKSHAQFWESRAGIDIRLISNESLVQRGVILADFYEP